MILIPLLIKLYHIVTVNYQIALFPTMLYILYSSITARFFCRKSAKIIGPFLLHSVRMNLAISKLELVYGDS